jgi:hypothetical protein
MLTRHIFQPHRCKNTRLEASGGFLFRDLSISICSSTWTNLPARTRNASTNLTFSFREIIAPSAIETVTPGEIRQRG